MKLHDAIAKAVRESLEHALRKHNRNVMAAARELGVHRCLIYKYARRYGVVVRPKLPEPVRSASVLSTWGRVQ